MAWGEGPGRSQEEAASAQAVGVGGAGSIPEPPFNLYPLSSGFSSPDPPAKAQGSKDGKPKQKVIIADCGEYV